MIRHATIACNGYLSPVVGPGKKFLTRGVVGGRLKQRESTDSVVEPTETIVLTLSVSPNHSIALGEGAATILLFDNDDGPPTLLGDPSQNGAVSALDASMILQHAAGSIALAGAAFIAGDVSGNGEISAFDASLILQYLVGILSCFPADAPCIFFFSSRRRHTRFALVSWARRCV